MRILIVLAEPFFPQQGGGSQTSALELLGAFEDKGLHVALASGLKRKSAFGLRSLGRMTVRRRRFEKGTYRAHRVYRVPSIHHNIPFVIDDFKSDVVLVQAMASMPVAHTISALGVPMVVYWRDAEKHRMCGTPVGLNARYIANSQFTASFYKQHFGVSSTVIPPLIRRERYIALQPTRESVVFIGTVPEKGLNVAIGVARACPDIPFEFVESWIMPHRRRHAVKSILASLPNVRFVPHQSDMLPIYSRARLLLAPSQWEEAWGRVASEAHINGIPVIGSNIGGLPEAIGPGGILVDPKASPSEWAEHIQGLWHDKVSYQRLSDDAAAYSKRLELDPSWALQRIDKELKEAMALNYTGSAW